MRWGSEGLTVHVVTSETVVEVLSHLQPADVSAVSRTCRLLYQVTQLEPLWRVLYQKRWPTESPPIPTRKDWKTLYIERSLKWRLWTPQFNQDPLKGLWHLHMEGKLGPKRQTITSCGDITYNSHQEAPLSRTDMLKWLSTLNPDVVADYLTSSETTAGINKREIAEFITDPDVIERTQIATAVMKKINFGGLSIEAALRRLFRTVSMPGTGQRSGILLNMFSQTYYQENPQEDIKEQDQVYTLTWSIIVLDTDLHSPKIRRKMSVATFVNLAQQSMKLTGTHVPDRFLSDIYSNIKKQPLSKLEAVEGNQWNAGEAVSVVTNWLSKWVTGDTVKRVNPKLDATERQSATVSHLGSSNIRFHVSPYGTARNVNLQSTIRTRRNCTTHYKWTKERK
ncbi:hypothetical protein PROFUN_05633 [Planoprotostelium fungivorum]|uniref:SEC7 domain-containing protein n=1 Tax=Planoprotostelium fungivorum TaxID=1890364 RepID=A0A2P6MUD5_9EUKA|nr:hypothetical protein PROFUN_05633 [Planoprotostelium fungivorum]